MHVYFANVTEYDPRRPIWIQVVEILRGRIEDGTYRPGQVMPSEKQLQQEFEIARGTARKVVAFLREEGLVVTVPMRGTFVASNKPVN